MHSIKKIALRLPSGFAMNFREVVQSCHNQAHTHRTQTKANPAESFKR